MCNKKSLKLLKQRISDARMILYDLQVFIKLGALASDSGIIDEDLQLDKGNDDYYILFRTLNKKLTKVLKQKQKPKEHKHSLLKN
ncbi:MAG: hypothetical protein NC408_07445 [Candidatus Gastranaerophilales bacterium]|nr:hypothetical protein [Candidatus Gastranaerophilales bacterium]